MTVTHAPPAIIVEGVTKRFGEVTAIEDLSFDVRGGAALVLAAWTAPPLPLAVAVERRRDLA